LTIVKERVVQEEKKVDKAQVYQAQVKIVVKKVHKVEVNIMEVKKIKKVDLMEDVGNIDGMRELHENQIGEFLFIPCIT
jgi:hypothetical protein